MRAPVGSNLNDGEEPQSAPGGGGALTEQERSEVADDRREYEAQSSVHVPNEEPNLDTTAQNSDDQNTQTAEHRDNVRVYADDDDRVMFEDPNTEMEEVQLDGGQAGEYSPTSPAGSQRIEVDSEPDDGMNSPPAPSRVRSKPRTVAIFSMSIQLERRHGTWRWLERSRTWRGHGR